MIVFLNQNDAPVLLDERNFRALKVTAHKDSSRTDIAAALGCLGVLDGDHVWLSIGRSTYLWASAGLALSVIEAQTSLALSAPRSETWYHTAFQRVDLESQRMRRLVGWAGSRRREDA